MTRKGWGVRIRVLEMPEWTRGHPRDVCSLQENKQPCVFIE